MLNFCHLGMEFFLTFPWKNPYKNDIGCFVPECATMKKHETNFRRPSSVESVRGECATMKKKNLLLR